MTERDQDTDATRPLPHDRIDFRAAFERAPIGMLVMHGDTIVATNKALCTLLGVQSHELTGERFDVLFPDGDAFATLAPVMSTALEKVGLYREQRLMRRQGVAGADAGFLCQVNLQYMDLGDDHQLLICTVDHLLPNAQDHADLTPRERDVATLLRKRYTAKEIGKVLGISHRTVEVHRARLMRKYGVKTGAALLRHLQQDSGDARSFGGDPTDPKDETPAVSRDGYRGQTPSVTRPARQAQSQPEGAWA